MIDNIRDWLFPLDARVARLERMMIHLGTIIIAHERYLKTQPDFPSPVLKFLEELRKRQHTPRD